VVELGKRNLGKWWYKILYYYAVLLYIIVKKTSLPSVCDNGETISSNAIAVRHSLSLNSNN